MTSCNIESAWMYIPMQLGQAARPFSHEVGHGSDKCAFGQSSSNGFRSSVAPLQSMIVWSLPRAGT